MVKAEVVRRGRVPVVAVVVVVVVVCGLVPNTFPFVAAGREGRVGAATGTAASCPLVLLTLGGSGP